MEMLQVVRGALQEKHIRHGTSISPAITSFPFEPHWQLSLSKQLGVFQAEQEACA